MKELSIEEKAKAYDKVREKIALSFGSNVADEIFSQFEMSEDERIRKELISFLQLPHPQFVGERKQEDWIAWLEKQGSEENKGNLGGISPNSAWSEEDERNIQVIDSVLFYDKSLPEDTCMRLRNWLESLKQRLRE